MTQLAIIQARVHSTRLPNKILLDVGGHPLLWWAWRAAIKVFEADNVVIAVPRMDYDVIRAQVREPHLFGWSGDENDVLGRVHACAHQFLVEGDDVLYRITPDDFPIDPFRESCTLAELDHWHETITDLHTREHIGTLFAPRLEINTLEDLEKARARVESQQRLDRSPV